MKLYFLALQLSLCLLIPFSAVAQQSSSADSSYIVQDSVLIPTRDGALISAAIVRKKGVRKPLPVILFFTTYYQGPSDLIFAKMPADRGYAGVVAYSRGIRTDLKNYTPYEHDGKDADDVINWISKQPWCNGKVGMFGGSYTGFVQWSAVKKAPPALKTIVPQVAVMPGFDTPLENNVFSTALALNWSNDILQKKPLLNDLYGRWYQNGTSYRSLDSLAGQPNRIFQKWLRHPAYDSYWKSLIPTPQEYANLNIPILTTTGYYDGDQPGDLEYLKQYNTYNKNPNIYLLIGPYDHRGARGRPSPNLMGYQIDNAANINITDVIFQWFDYVLKNGKKPEILKDKINYEVMGGNKWRHAPSLEKMNNDTLTFYLSGRKNGDDYLLDPQKPKKNHYLNQSVDFKERITQNNYFTPFIINDSLNASHGLTFVTKPFSEEFSINGSFSGKLTASINKKDMDISIAFYELMPSGKYFYLTRYLGRASYAKNRSKRTLLTPHTKETIPLADTRMVSKKIDKGSRLVIILNINKHPYEEINYGSGKVVSDETIKDAGEPLQIKWYNNSFIKIPVWIDK